MAPVYKKGEHSNPTNYRPISLTCILGKTLEHIVASSITKHLSKLNISNMASERSALVNPSSSCWLMIFSNLFIRKSKLISFCLTSAKSLIKSATRNLLSNYMTMVFIRGPALKWVKRFLDNLHSSVIVSGSSSEPIPVSSGVLPQGYFLGPLLFLIYINDLPMNIKSKVRLFILPSQHLPNQRFSRKILTTFNAGVINGNLTQKPNFYTVYSSQLHTGICIFSKVAWCRHLFRPIMGYQHTSHF